MQTQRKLILYSLIPWKVGCAKWNFLDQEQESLGLIFRSVISLECCYFNWLFFITSHRPSIQRFWEVGLVISFGKVLCWKSIEKQWFYWSITNFFLFFSQNRKGIWSCFPICWWCQPYPREVRRILIPASYYFLTVCGRSVYCLKRKSSWHCYYHYYYLQDMKDNEQ